MVTYPDFVIEDFSPKTGSVNTEVTITGKNFGDYKPATKITFGEAEVVDYISYSDTEIVVKVPAGATTSPVAMKVWTNTHKTAEDFVYVPGPEISSISNSKTVAGAVISIYGVRFGDKLDGVKVYFTGKKADDSADVNYVEAEVVSVEDSEIKVEVPTEGTNGAIYILVDGFNMLEGPLFFYPINIQYLFDVDGDFEGWRDSSKETSSKYGTSTLTVEDGCLVVNYDMEQKEFNRTDITIDDLYVDPIDYPILAVKWVNAAKRTFRLHSSNGNFKNSSAISNYDGVTGSEFDVYYYDLSKGFGTGTDTSKPFELEYLRWITTENISTGNTCSKIEWIRNFESVDALSEFLAGTGDAAPVPSFSSLSDSEAGIGETISIHGSNFGDDASIVKVFFGGDIKAQVLSVTDTQIDVVVPAGGVSGALTVYRGGESTVTSDFTYILISNIEFLFETADDTEGWYDAHPHASVDPSVMGGSMMLEYNKEQFVYNTAKIRLDNAVVDPTTHPIIAIKWTYAPSKFHLHSNLGYYKGSNASTSNHDGILGAQSDVYYYDLTNGLGDELTEATALEYLEWEMTEYPATTGNDYSLIKWIRHFESKEALEKQLEEDGDASDGNLPDPTISSISKSSGYVGEIVSIYGSNFGSDASNIEILFGSTEATVQVISNVQIDVIVPDGAQDGAITVTRSDATAPAVSADSFDYLESIMFHDFETADDTQGWYDGTPASAKENAYLSVVDGHLVLNYDWVTNTKPYNRLDLYLAEPKFDAAKNPILAVKWVNVSRFIYDTAGTIKLHSSLGNFRNNNNTKNYTGVTGVDSDVLYYDLNSGFGGNLTVPTPETEIAYIDFVGTMKNTDCPNTKVAWVRTFASVDALNAYLSVSGE